VEDDVDVWRYAILELHVRNDDDDEHACYYPVTTGRVNACSQPSD